MSREWASSISLIKVPTARYILTDFSNPKLSKRFGDGQPKICKARREAEQSNLCKFIDFCWRLAIINRSSLKIIFVFVSPYETNDVEFGEHLIKHGDGVKDVAFEVEDLDVIVKRAKERGAKVLKDIWEESDEFGKARFALLQTVRHIASSKSNCNERIPLVR